LEDLVSLNKNTMKAFKLMAIGIMLIISGAVKAQVSVTVNIGSPPLWGPVGYAEARYYYLPDVEAYYDIHTSMFIYYGGGAWIHRTYLPGRYRGYDLYSGYKVVMVDYYGNTPYTNFPQYKMKYKKGYRGEPQKSIGMKPGKGNSPSKMAPKSNPTKNVSHDNNKGKSQGNNKNSNHQGNGGGKGKKK
jgi:hypothetical protein